MRIPMRELILMTYLLLITACSGELVGTGDGSDNVSDEQNGYHGQAILGPVINATIRVEKLFGEEGVLCSTVTTESTDLDVAGTFTIPEDCITQPEILYVVSFSDGQDIDADDDGVIDPIYTTVTGTYHAILSGDQMLIEDWKVSAATEAAYQAVQMGIDMLQLEVDEIKKILDEHGSEFLKDDLSGDGTIDYTDTLIWHPVRHREAVLDFDFVLSIGVEYMSTEHSTEMIDEVTLDEVLVAHVNTVNSAQHVAVLNEHALIATNFDVHVVDIVQTTPIITSSIVLPQPNRLSPVYGDKILYIRSFNNKQLSIAVSRENLYFIDHSDGTPALAASLSLENIDNVIEINNTIYAYVSSGGSMWDLSLGTRRESSLYKINIDDINQPYIEEKRQDLSLLTLGIYNNELWAFEIDQEISSFSVCMMCYSFQADEYYWLTIIDPDSLMSQPQQQIGEIYSDEREYVVADASFNQNHIDLIVIPMPEEQQSSLPTPRMFEMDLSNSDTIENPVELPHSTANEKTVAGISRIHTETDQHYITITDTYHDTGIHQGVLKVWNKTTLQPVLEYILPRQNGIAMLSPELVESNNRLYLAAGYFGLLVIQLPES